MSIVIDSVTAWAAQFQTSPEFSTESIFWPDAYWILGPESTFEVNTPGLAVDATFMTLGLYVSGFKIGLTR